MYYNNCVNLKKIHLKYESFIKMHLFFKKCIFLKMHLENAHFNIFVKSESFKQFKKLFKTAFQTAPF